MWQSLKEDGEKQHQVQAQVQKPTSESKELCRRDSRCPASGGKKLRGKRVREDSRSRSRASGGKVKLRSRIPARVNLTRRRRRQDSRDGRSRRASGGRKFQRLGDSREASAVASESIKRRRGRDADNYMTRRDVSSLGEDTKARLREAMPKEKAQTRFKHFNWSAASGAKLEETSRVRQRKQAVAAVHVSLTSHAPKMPRLSQYVHGVNHFNTSEEKKGKLMHPIQSWHSTKMHFLHMLKEEMLDPIERTKLKIASEFPDLFEFQRQDSDPASGGKVQPISGDNLDRLAEKQKFKHPVSASFLQHLFSFHDGEVRMVGKPWWENVPDTSRTILKKACFWRDQFMHQDSACQSRVPTYLPAGEPS